MAKVIINEIDLTSEGTTTSTDNVVYIPGYATTGPINEPTVCSTLDEFYTIFGSQPYKFKNNQTINGSIIAESGDPELSFIYAEETLKSGLKVMYERLKPSFITDVNDGKAYSTITAYATSKLISNELLNKSVSLLDGTLTSGTVTSITNITSQNDLISLNQENQITSLIISDNAAIPQVLFNYEWIEEYLDSFTISYQNNQLLITRVEETADTDVNKFTSLEITKVGDNQQITLIYKNATVISSVSLNFIPNFAISINDSFIEVRDFNGNIISNLFTFELNDSNLNVINSIYNNLSGICYNLNISNIPLILDTTTPVFECLLKSKDIGTSGNNDTYKFSDLIFLAGNNSTYVSNIQTNINDLISEKTVSFDNENSLFISNIITDLDISVTYKNNGLELVKKGLFNFNSNDLNVSKKFTAAVTEDVEQITIAQIYNSFITQTINEETIDSIFEKLKDTFNYNIKFITTGAYYNISSYANVADTFIVANNLLRVAAERGDSTTLLNFSNEYKNSQLFDLTQSGLIYEVNERNEDIRNYGTIIAPNIKINSASLNSIVNMPASLAYLKACGYSFQTKATWVPVAGPVRGIISGMTAVNEVVSSVIMNQWQQRSNSIAINPIINLPNYGFVIYGNRTSHKNINNLTASSFLNIRLGSNDIKKVLREAATSLMFETNNSTLWYNFRGKVEPYLDKMVSGGGLLSYKLEKVTSTEKGKIKGIVRVVPVEGVEDFELDFSLQDSILTV